MRVSIFDAFQTCGVPRAHTFFFSATIGADIMYRRVALRKLNRCASYCDRSCSGGMFGVDLVVGSLFLVVAHASSVHSHAGNNCSAAPLLRYGSQSWRE